MKTHSNKYPIYPDFQVLSNDGAITIKSTIRKNHDGKWFLWDVIERTSGMILEPVLKRFMMSCYLVILFGSVNEIVADSDGVPIFELDANQESEEERLNKKN